MKINKYFLGLLTVAGLFSFQSCDDESYDVVGNPDNLIYFPSKGQLDNVSAAVETFTVVSTPVGYFGDEIYAKFGVSATRPMDGTATVTATIDNSLVETFNTENGTEYKTTSAAVLQKASVSVGSGAYISSDSIEVVIPEDKYSGLSEKGTYLIPVRLESTTRGKVTVTKNLAYVVVNLEEKLIKEDAGSGDITGTKVSDRSVWTATTTDASVDENSIARIFDGNTGSGASFSNEENPIFTLDMHATNKVTALYFKNSSSSWGSYYNFSRIGVELSTDGNNWTDAGTAAPVVENNTDQYIILYGAVPARYVRLSLQWSNGGGSWGYYYRTFNELDVYVE